MADTKLSALTAATALGSTDELYVNDGGTSKRITFANLSKTVVTDQTAKATPVVADELLISDSEASNAAKKSTIAQVKAAMTIQDAKAWVNFNGTGTVSVRASYNVSSVTDNGTGDYTVNFTDALSDENYVVAGSCMIATNNAAFFFSPYGNAPTASGFRFYTTNFTGTASDTAYVEAMAVR